MTEEEKHLLYEAIKRNVPDYYDRLQQKLQQKRDLIQNCIVIASHYDDDYQDEINTLYKSSHVFLNVTEIILLNYICLIKHKERFNNGILKEDEEIQKWIRILQSRLDMTESEDCVIDILKRMTQKTIKQYRIKKSIGRPKGQGKMIFSYNGKEYHTIQQCADDYSISKQGMRKRLKRLRII